MTDNQDLPRVVADSARGGFFLLSGTALSSVIIAISAILIGRLLGPQLYGQYSLILVVPSFLFLFTDLGINAGITKYAASLRLRGDHEQVRSIIRNGILFQLGIGVTLTVACIVFSSYFALLVNRPDLNFWIQLVAITVTLQVVFTSANSAFVGIDRAELNALVTNVQALIRTAGQVILVLLGFGLGGAIIGYLGGFAVSSVIAAFLLFRVLRRKHEQQMKPYPSYRRVLSLLVHYGMPVYVAVVLTGFFGLYQQMVLSFFVSDVAIGNFRAAFNFVMLLSMVMAALATALLAAFSKLESFSFENLNLFARKTNKYIGLVLIPATTLVILYAEPIVHIIYGAGYNSAAQFLQVNVTVYFFVGLGYLWLTSLFNGLAKTKLSMQITFVNFIVLLFLSPLLAAVYGVMGAILAYVSGAFAASIYSTYLAKKQLRVELEHKSTMRIFVTAVLSVVPSFGLMLIFPSTDSLIMLITGVIIYLLTYVTLMPLLKVVDVAELKTMCQLTSKIPFCSKLTKILRAYQTRILHLLN